MGSTEETDTYISKFNKIISTWTSLLLKITNMLITNMYQLNVTSPQALY